MPKTKTVPVNPPSGVENQEDKAGGGPEPLSGSKEVKNKNHSRNNQGEGS